MDGRASREGSDHRRGRCRADRRHLHGARQPRADAGRRAARSEEHTSELQSLMRISYAVFCLKKKKPHITVIQYEYHTYAPYTSIINHILEHYQNCDTSLL